MSAVARGLFVGNPWSLDVSGGFASPLAAELIGAADLIVGWGLSIVLGDLLPPERVVAVDSGNFMGYPSRYLLSAVATWLAGPRNAPMLIDAKVTRDRGSWWLEEAFRGH